MVDYILYNKLGENPTDEQIEELLKEYQISLREHETTVEQTKLLIDRLNDALLGNPLYTDSHKEFRKKIAESLRQFDKECNLKQS